MIVLVIHADGQERREQRTCPVKYVDNICLYYH